MMSKKYKSFNIQSNVEVYEWGGNMSIDIDNPCQGSDSFELTKQQAMDFFGLVEPNAHNNMYKAADIMRYISQEELLDEDINDIFDDFLNGMGYKPFS